MRTVGVRELKARASEVLRAVRRRRTPIDVTHHGRVVARLVPVGPEGGRARPPGATWSSLEELAREIGARWPRGRSAAAAVREGRRDL
jgi:prevent-host-death family protein